MILIWTSPARLDRRAIREYISRDNGEAAMRLDAQCSRRADQLLAHPMMGRPGRMAATRELVVRPNYLLVYDITGEVVRILRVLHAAQQWPEE